MGILLAGSLTAGREVVPGSSTSLEQNKATARRWTVCSFSDDLDVVLAGKPHTKPLAGQWLVVHDDRPDHASHSTTLPVSVRMVADGAARNGMVTETQAPPESPALAESDAQSP